MDAFLTTMASARHQNQEENLQTRNLVEACFDRIQKDRSAIRIYVQAAATIPAFVFQVLCRVLTIAMSLLYLLTVQRHWMWFRRSMYLGQMKLNLQVNTHRRTSGPMLPSTVAAMPSGGLFLGGSGLARLQNRPSTRSTLCMGIKNQSQKFWSSWLMTKSKVETLS